jgi:hypothetical protein
MNITNRTLRLKWTLVPICLFLVWIAFQKGGEPAAQHEPGGHTGAFSPEEGLFPEAPLGERGEIELPVSEEEGRKKVSPADSGLTAAVPEAEESGAEIREAESAPLLGPSDARELQFPPVRSDRLAGQLPEPLRETYARIRLVFPETDLTEVQAYHAMISDKRDTFGFDLTDETRPLFREWIAEADALHREMVNLRAAEHGVSLGGMEDGRGYALIGFEDGRPSYTFTANVEAAISTGANLVRWSYDFDPALGATVDGTGLYVNVNDYEKIVEHNEFQLPDGGGSRIMVAETPWYDASGDHMTHVAGTVAAWGYDARLLGMAPRVWIRSLIQQTTSHVSTYGMSFPGELHNVENPRTGEMQIKSVMGTTSLGSDESDLRYTARSRSFDIVLRDHPYYVHFYAAGNNGSGFGTISNNEQLAKNVITIGAASDVSRDKNGIYVSGGNIAGFSSRGPTYDGRIKPDFVANGVGLRSTSGTSGSSNKSGTSMATPNASGSTVLLIDYVQQRFPGHFFRSSTYKSLLMNTADDRGNAGPDYIFGWGIVNVHAAGQIIRRHAENPYDRVVREERLHPGQTWTYTYHSDGVEPIRASLAWLDVAGDAQSSTSTDRSPRLVNDLDMRITGPDDSVYEPFVMPFVTGQGDTPAFDSSLHNASATTGDNFTDPAEQILIAAPAAGTYTIQITHKGTLSGGQPQPFSLAVSGLRSAAAEPAVISSVSPDEGNNTNNFAMSVLGSGFVLGSDVLLRRDGSPVVKAYRVIPVGDRIDFRVDTAGIDKGFYDVVVRAPDGTESVLQNGFLMPAEGGSSGRVTLYSNTFESADGLTLTGNWEVGVPNQSSVGGPGSAFTGTQVLGTYLNGNYTNNLNIFATLPPISTVNRTNVRLEFRRWLGVDRTTGGGAPREDFAWIEFSLTGTGNWHEIWSATNINDSHWNLQTFNLPTAVNNQAQVYLRFRLVSDHSNVSYGWNIDDLRVTGEAAGGLLLPPVFTSEPVTTATQGEAYSYMVTTSDADTPVDQLTLAAGSLPAGLSFTDNGDGTGLLSGTPTGSGAFEITLSVTDGDYTTWQVFDLLIFPEGGNTPPEIITSSIPAANEAQPYEALIEAVDADGHALSFSVGPLPGWLSFTDNGNGTATLSGTPNTVGTFTVSVSVTDGFETDQQSYSLVVNPRPRIGFTVSSVEVWEDAGSVTVHVARTLNDAGEVSVNYATQNGEAVAGTDYAATSGTLTWADGELGSKPVTVSIFDDDFTQGDREFTVRLSNLSSIATMGTSILTVTILDNNENTPPEITLDSPGGTRVAIPPGMGLRVSGSVSDDGLPEWGTFTQGWTVEEKPEGSSVSFTDETEINTGITFSHEGVYTLVFTADDGEFSDSLSLRVEVTDEVSGGLPQENLALWLPLDESSGSTAADESGSGRHGTITGSPEWRPNDGAIGGALRFTANSQYAVLANSTDLDNVGQMSWAWWMRPSAQNSDVRGILSKRDSANSGQAWSFFLHTNNQLTVDMPSSGNRLQVGAIPANEWTHVAVVFDGSQVSAERVRVYMNGELSGTYSASITTLPSRSNSVVLGLLDTGDTRSFRGDLDEVILYHDRALSAEEILQIMQGGGGGNLGPLVVIDPVAGAQAQEPVQLSATVTDDGLPEDPGTVSLLWEQVDGPGTVSFDDPSILTPAATFPVSGSYVLRLSAHDGVVTTYAEVSVVVEESGPFAPIILTQPVSQTVLAGETVTLSVVASGNPEPTYQWYLNGTLIDGATAYTYTIAAMGPEHEGSYMVRVSNDSGHVDSDPALLDLLPPPATPVSVMATTLSNSSISLSWSDPGATQAPADSYEIESAPDGVNWTPLAQVTETGYLHTGLAPQTTRFYRVRALNAAGSSAWSGPVSATTLEGEPEELLRYEFTHGQEGLNPTFSAADLVSGPVANGGGLSRFRTDEGGAVDSLSVVNNSTRTNVDEAFASNEFFTITLAPTENQTLSLEELNFNVTRGGTAGTRHFAVRSSLDPGANLIGPKQPESARTNPWDFEVIDLSGPEFQGLADPVTFYFIVATDDLNRSLEFDDISFIGILASSGEGNETFTVTFVDYDGTVLKIETVEAGQAATAPEDPVRTGYIFIGWDVPFGHITGDLTVTALYQPEEPDQGVTRYWGGGTANWTGTDSWFDNPGLSGIGQIWQDGWDVMIQSGDPALNASVTVGNLHIDNGARVRIGGGNQVLTVTGETTGTGTVRFDRTDAGNTSGLRFENDTAQTVAWDFLLNNDQCRIRLEIAGSAPVTLDGTMQAWGNAFDIIQESGSHVIFGPNARVNNNRSDLINARPFQVWPADATAIFEMHADFNVDLADPDVFENTYPFAKPEDDPGDGFYVKPVGGLSTWRTVSGTTITHTTQNLASIHKYTDTPIRYTHHGLWNFEGSGSEPHPEWIVRTNPQSYDGGIYFVRDWTLNTEEDFTFEGLWHDGVNIGFSTRSGAQNITFTKTGPADFIIKGTQAYGPGSVMRVEEGGVRFHTDPMVGAVPKANNSWFNNTGDYLNLEVHAGAEASFLPPAGETFHLASADIAGSLILHVHEAPALAVSGNLTVSGTLVIQPEITLSASSYVVATVTGQIDLTGAVFDVSEGWEVVVEGSDILLQPQAETFEQWIADNYPPETTPEDDDSRGGMTLTVRQVWLAGLTPNGTDVFRIYFDESGTLRHEPDLGVDRVYRIYWTDDLTIDPEEWNVWEEDAPLSSEPAVFFRVEVGLP